MVKDLTGKVFGKWTVLSKADRKAPYWRCKCECGVEREVRNNSLTSGGSKGCGGSCTTQLRSDNAKKHGMSHSKIYRTWSSMISRCTNSNHHAAKSYCDRGITVCDRWLVFDNFLSDMGNKPFPSAQIDRINNNDGYHKANCRWVTSKVNNNNTRRNRYIEYNGVVKSLSEWADIIGVNYTTLRHRIHTGYPIEVALTKKLHKGYRHVR